MNLCCCDFVLGFFFQQSQTSMLLIFITSPVCCSITAAPCLCLWACRCSFNINFNFILLKYQKLYFFEPHLMKTKGELEKGKYLCLCMCVFVWEKNKIERRWQRRIEGKKNHILYFVSSLKFVFIHGFCTGWIIAVLPDVWLCSVC